MASFDLKIVNARIVDGSGARSATGSTGSIAIQHGLIVAMGDVIGDADTVVDARGHVVCPGFIDIHTHYDAQIMWDPMLTISPFHGVTTTVIGNCGFGVAPAKPEHHDRILRTLERVEGMPYESTLAGLSPHWTFETFPEYLDAIDRCEPAINVCALVPHSTLRIYVMGDDADQREATPDEIDEMAQIVRGAMLAGAWGLSTSNHKSHFGYKDRLVPSLYASYDEYRALIMAMAESGCGTLETTRGAILDIATLGALGKESGRPITLSALMADEEGKGSHYALLRQIEDVQRQGVELWPQVSPRPITLRFTLTRPNMFSHTAPGTIPGADFLDDLFDRLLEPSTVAERMAVLTDPGFRQEFLERTSSDGWNYLWGKTLVSEVDGRPELTDHPIAALAEAAGRHPSEILLDLGYETELQAIFAVTHLNGDENEVAVLLGHPGTRIGVTDAGAHVSELCDACYPTHLLGHWVRERGEFSLERAVAMLTSEAAQVYGIADRGVLRVGAAADLVVFDPETVGATSLRRVYDLPAGAPRLVSDARGIDHVIVNGQRLLDHGDIVARRRPGRVLRTSTARSQLDQQNLGEP